MHKKVIKKKSCEAIAEKMGPFKQTDVWMPKISALILQEKKLQHFRSLLNNILY